MPLITKLGLDDAYKALKGQFREIRAQALTLRTAAAAGPISFSTVREYFETLNRQITFCDAMAGRFNANALQAYAREQEDSVTYAPITEYNTMKAAAQAVINHITTVLPANSSHTISNGRVVEPSFTSVQTSTLRGLLDTLIGTLSAP